jgi:hypothetical protein
MKAFLLDIWHDLREKRLWPVAVVLLLGLVAVPVVLSKPAGDSASDPVPATAARKAPDPEDLRKLASVELAESDAGQGSPLDTFDPANPFRPPASVVRAQDADDESLVVEDSTSVEVDAGAPSSGGGSTAPSDGGSTPTTPGGTTVPGEDKTTTTQYRYVIDVTFSANGQTRRIKTLERLDMLPSQDKPLLLFLGVETGGDNAVLLVDSTLTAAGEGSCRPSKDECAFLHIGAGSEHEFTNEAGDSYTLRVNEIRKVEVDARAAKTSRAKRPKASASVGAERSRFVPELIDDLVSVSSSAAETSTPDSDRR